MTVSETLIHKMLTLPEDKRRQVLEFVERLEQESTAPAERRQKLYGLCSDVRSDLPFEEFRKVRDEMWGRSTDEELQ